MRVRDEDIDVMLIVREERVHVPLVEEARTLGLGQDEVGEEEEAEGGVEGEPTDEEVGPVFEEGEEREDDPVHEPGGEEGGVGGAERFVGGEDGEEDGEEGAGRGVSTIDVWEGLGALWGWD